MLLERAAVGVAATDGDDDVAGAVAEDADEPLARFRFDRLMEFRQTRRRVSAVHPADSGSPTV